MESDKIRRFLQTLGPGLLYAGAAIGVSHLVQSTRAGADFGFGLVWAVLLANLLKYPFFEYGPRYAAATGETLIEGYKRLGNWAIVLFLLLTVGTMFTIQAAVTVVTAGLANEITGTQLDPWQWSGILLLLCLAILAIGRFSVLDKVIKVIIVVLSVTTLVALIFALSASGSTTGAKPPFSFSDNTHIFFLIALMGWMPAPIDISIWHSVWSLAKVKETGYRPKLKESLLDFNIGYWGTTILALCFLSLGALVIYSSGEELSPKGGVFAGQVISIYTRVLGSEFYWVIAIAAFTTMFSTTMTCLDAFPRVLRKAGQVVFPSLNTPAKDRQLYWGWIVVTALGALTIIGFLMQNMKVMVDVATTISFLTAPVLAILNYLTIHGKNVPEASRPGLGMKVVSWLGIVFLCGVSIYYLYIRFVG